MKKSWVIFFAIICFLLPAPQAALALTMAEIVPETQNIQVGPEAQAYIVVDKNSGEIILSKNSGMLWPPASLTKLVTALVFLDTKTGLNKVVIMKKEDEVGGQRLATKAGIAYTARDLLHAALIASDNNAAHALARSTGLSSAQFSVLMNRKAESLGAINTIFYEPTGMNPSNKTTAADYAKIVEAAFSNSYLSSIAKKSSYSFTAVNNKKYKHTLTTTDKLLADSDLEMLGGKTGYLAESQYNFAGLVKDKLANEFIVVLLGAGSARQQFGQAKTLALQATAIKAFAGAVLGTSTQASLQLVN